MVLLGITVYKFILYFEYILLKKVQLMVLLRHYKNFRNLRRIANEEAYFYVTDDNVFCAGNGFFIFGG